MPLLNVLRFQEMADITSKTAIAPLTPKSGHLQQGSGNGSASGVGAGPPTSGNVVVTGGSGVASCCNPSPNHHGFNSLPSSIHHGLSERLHGLTEKLHALHAGSAGKSSDSDGPRSRTGKKRKILSRVLSCAKRFIIPVLLLGLLLPPQ